MTWPPLQFVQTKFCQNYICLYQKREFPRSFSENIIAANTVSKGVRMPWWKDKKNKQREADPKDKKLGQSR